MDHAKKRSITPRFRVGDKVRVKSGVTVPDFEDIPLCGWAGTIKKVETSADPVIEVEWDKRTLAGMHPVYRKRCERDDCEIKTMYLGEEDVERDDGTPFLMEQPTRIVTRPLSKDRDLVFRFDYSGAGSTSKNPATRMIPPRSKNWDESRHSPGLTPA
jgi:hypothetical protein